jgi:hypothetical protein
MNQDNRHENEFSSRPNGQDLSANPTSWDAIVEDERPTPRMGPTAKKSPVAESTNSVVSAHRQTAPTNKVTHSTADIASLIPDGTLPPGVTEEEIRLLKRFIDMNFNGHQLTPESQARVRDAAAKVGLSEVLIDQMLEQARLKREIQQQNSHNYYEQPSLHHVAPDNAYYNTEYPHPPGNTTHHFKRENKEKRYHRDEPCYDACQVLGNIKDNLLFFAGCNNDYDDDASSVGK